MRSWPRPTPPRARLLGHPHRRLSQAGGPGSHRTRPGSPGKKVAGGTPASRQVSGPRLGAPQPTPCRDHVAALSRPAGPRVAGREQRCPLPPASQATPLQRSPSFFPRDPAPEKPFRQERNSPEATASPNPTQGRPLGNPSGSPWGQNQNHKATLQPSPCVHYVQAARVCPPEGDAGHAWPRARGASGAGPRACGAGVGSGQLPRRDVDRQACEGVQGTPGHAHSHAHDRTLTGSPSAPACHSVSPGTGGSAPRRSLPGERKDVRNRKTSPPETPRLQQRRAGGAPGHGGQGQGDHPGDWGQLLPRPSPSPAEPPGQGPSPCSGTGPQALVGAKALGSLLQGPQPPGPLGLGISFSSPGQHSPAGLTELRVHGKHQPSPTECGEPPLCPHVLLPPPPPPPSAEANKDKAWPSPMRRDCRS